MKKLLESKWISCILGLLLIAYGIFDIYEELFEPSHEHILIFIGFLLVINAISHTQEGLLKVLRVIRKDRKNTFLERVERTFDLPIVRIILGVTVLVASYYGLSEDLENLHSKSVSMGVGLLLMTLPTFGAFMAGKNLSKGLKKEDSQKRE